LGKQESITLLFLLTIAMPDLDRRHPREKPQAGTHAPSSGTGSEAKDGSGGADLVFKSKKKIKATLQSFRRRLMSETSAVMMRNSQLLGRIASWQVRTRTTISSLQDIEFKVSSQWGEDGIIDWLIERARIPPISQSFVEFGVETYREANTRFLLQNRNWRGLIMDANPAVSEAVKQDSLSWEYDLTVQPAFITRENINELILTAGFDGDLGLLSIDLDGNDYWIWEAIQAISPIICICEYNAVFGDIQPVSIPYDRTFHRTRAHHSNLYYGASIAALLSLGARKGYRFVGTNSAGNNAFFVREDFAKQFADTSLHHVRALPSLLRESRDERGRLNYIGGMERLKPISTLPVVNVETGATARLGDLGPVYSKEWREALSHGATV
jgi:hypothetical protein